MPRGLNIERMVIVFERKIGGNRFLIHIVSPVGVKGSTLMMDVIFTWIFNSFPESSNLNRT